MVVESYFLTILHLSLKHTDSIVFHERPRRGGHLAPPSLFLETLTNSVQPLKSLMCVSVGLGKNTLVLNDRTSYSLAPVTTRPAKGFLIDRAFILILGLVL
jgi:hypothetical protein